MRRASSLRYDIVCLGVLMMDEFDGKRFFIEETLRDEAGCCLGSVLINAEDLPH